MRMVSNSQNIVIYKNLSWCVWPGTNPNGWYLQLFHQKGENFVTFRAFVTAAATTEGTHSRTIANAPACCNSRASSKISRALTAVRPCALNPPNTPIRWGVRPTWPITGMPESTNFLTILTRTEFPPSILTASTLAYDYDRIKLRCHYTSLTNRRAFTKASWGPSS